MSSALGYSNEKVYLIASVIHFLGVTFYAIFASGEKQPWAEPTDDDDGDGEEQDAAIDSLISTSGFAATATKTAVLALFLLV